MKKYFFLGSVLLILIAGIGYFIYVIYSMPDMRAEISVKEVNSERLDKSVYFKRITAGLNYEVKIISSSSDKDKDTDSERDYIFSSSADLFYKFKGDTLIVYTYHLAEVPANDNFPIVIQQKKISSNLDYQRMQKQYRGLGLNKF